MIHDRWIATIHYRSANGLIDVTHVLAELEELHDVVERGPHWDTIDRIEVVRNESDTGLTIEAAEQL